MQWPTRESELFEVNFRQRCPIGKKFLICNWRIGTAKNLQICDFQIEPKNIADLQFADRQLAFLKNCDL
jgi:hypothetical protein